MSANSLRAVPLSLLLLLPPAVFSHAQAPAAGAPAGNAAPRQSGTVKAITPKDFVLTTAAGQDVAVTVPATAKILLVPPGSRDLSAAQPGTMADIAGGDRAIVSGTPGDAAAMLNATRVIVMKSTAIAANREAAQAAWAQGAGGIVRSVDPAKGVITLASGMRTLTVDTSPKTIVRRYAGASVRFEDAVASTVPAIHAGDQLRVRGERSADGNVIIADEIVTGSFSNFSGIVSAVDPATGTVTLKDLATKRPVTVAVTEGSNLRRLPPGAAGMMGGRAGAGGESGGGEGGGGHSGQPGSAPVSDQAEGAGAQRGGGERSGGGGTGRAGGDLSRMMNRLPTETLAGLKPGDAVMIVAANNPQTGQPTAISLLVGVEQILAAHPSGETTLSPWSLGGAGAEGDAGGGGDAGPR